MSFRGGPRNRGGGFTGYRGGSGGGRGGRVFQQPAGPPDSVLEMGKFMHACEGEMVCKSTNLKIPYFNAPIYLENKTMIGKVDEILGKINEVYFTIKPGEGIQATSFSIGDTFFIGGDKLLPLERFLPKPKPPPGQPKPKRAGGITRGGSRGRGPQRAGARGRGNFGASRGRGGAPFGTRGGVSRGRGSRGSFGGRGRGR